MYLAIKWLFTMVLAMWIILCLFDQCMKKNKETVTGPNIKPNHNFITFKGAYREKNKPYNHRRRSMAMFNYFAFFSGALVVTVYNKKKEIIRYMQTSFIYARSKFVDIKIHETVLDIACKFHKCITPFCEVATPALITFIEKLDFLRKLLKAKVIHIYLLFRNRNKKPRNRSILNSLLLKRVQEIATERNNMGQLLITALQENKNIRLRYQLENLAKNRLYRQIQDTQKLIKENRTKYMNFQQLYLVTHEENTFLKSRVKKLTEEKIIAEKNLSSLIAQVHVNGDSRLKSFCNELFKYKEERFLKTNFGTEVKAFLQRQSYAPVASTSNWALNTNKSSLKLSKTNSAPSTWTDVVPPEDSCVSLLKAKKPKLRGLPGEYVWTIKDKDGMIEKLYEYDCGFDFDNGDTIRRIREYSVYHDKDCLVDFAKSTTVFNTDSSTINPEKASSFEIPTNRKFLTGSPVFQQFLQENKNFLSFTNSRTSSPPLLCS